MNRYKVTDVPRPQFEMTLVGGAGGGAKTSRLGGGGSEKLTIGIQGGNCFFSARSLN